MLYKNSSTKIKTETISSNPVATKLLNSAPLEAHYTPNDDFTVKLGTGRTTSLLSQLRQQNRHSKPSPKSGYRGQGRINNIQSYGQRVIVKGRFFKSSGRVSANNLRAHISYLSRSGVAKSGKEVEFMTSTKSLSKAEASKHVSAWMKDPHHFRFILSPEAGFELDLEDYARAVMRRMSVDLATELEWVATCHHNTDNPHCHIILRGVNAQGEKLIISRDYIRQGLRQTAELEATTRLGRVTEADRADRIDREVQKLGATAIDWKLERQAIESPDGIVRVFAPSDNAREWQQNAYVASVTRLHFLQSRGLAERHGSDGWRLAPGLLDTLKEIGRRQEIEEKFGRVLVEKGLQQPLEIHSDKNPVEGALLGEVVGRGIYDEISDRSFILLSGNDGKTHYVPLDATSEPDGFHADEGAIVEIKTKLPTRQADASILKESREGVFSLSAFAEHVESENQRGRWRIPEEITLDQYIGLFERRAETLAAQGFITKAADDTYLVPKDLLQKVQELDAKLGVTRLTEVKVKSYHSMAAQVDSVGATWLDQLLAGEQSLPDAPASLFSQALESALTERSQLRPSASIIELRAGEMRELINRLSNKHGHHRVLTKAGTERFTLEGYELLSDGYYMVLRKPNMNEFAVRKVMSLEPRFENKAEIDISTEVSRGTGRIYSKARLVREETLDRGVQ